MKNLNKSASLAIVFFIYVLAVIVGYIVLQSVPYQDSMIKVLMADVAATVIVFIFSVILKNSSVYDAYWSVIPPCIALYLIFINPNGNSIRQYLIFGLILFWAIRLTANWARGWENLRHEDWRYGKIANDTGKFYWPVSFIGIHLMPTLFAFMGCLPFWFGMQSAEPVNMIDLIAVVVTFIAIVIEWRADEQLRNFKKKANPDAYMNKGLWSRMRHPNYFGEILFWVGLFLFVPASKSYDGWWTAVGLVSMVILFKFISIPLMDTRSKARRRGYDQYIAKVNALIPLKKQ
jgi:steroid 5-alpha reductase family enzyme